MIEKEQHIYSLNEFGLSKKKVEHHFKDYMMNYEF